MGSKTFYLKCGLLLLISLCPGAASGQIADSALYLSAAEYQQMVREHHPVALQAALRNRQGLAQVRTARGAFDPYAFAEVNQKQFQGKNYYQYGSGGLKVPTWFGVEFKLQYDQSSGTYLNPERLTPENGLLAGGVSVALGQGLFLDERRQALRQAQIFRQSTEADRLALLNNLMLESLNVYWEWYGAFYKVGVYQQGYELAARRAEAVLQGAVLGERPAVDTLEARIQRENRQIELANAKLELSKAQAYLSAYLWSEGEIPLELTEQVAPQPVHFTLDVDLDPEIQAARLDSLLNQHPDFLMAQFKIEQLNLERRWKLEQLKPTINLNYNLLSARAGTGEEWFNYSQNNYKWGVEFAYPIFLRKARGGLLATNLKLQEAEISIKFKQQQLLAKAIALNQEVIVSQQQVGRYTQVVDDYQLLVAAEQRLFNVGESSLFLVNSREQSFISAQVKLIEMQVKSQKAQAASNNALGQVD